MKEETEKMLVDAIINLGVNMDNLRKDVHKTNLLLAEHSRSILAIADQIDRTNKKIDNLSSDFNKYAQRNDDRAAGHETRIVRLEKTYGGSGGQGYVAKEPVIPYKKRKKRK